MSNSKSNWSRSRTLESAAIVAGFAGLALALVGPSGRLFSGREASPDTTRASEVHGARLDSMGSNPAAGGVPPGPVPQAPYGMRNPIPAASFDMASQVDGVAKRENGRLTFERTRDGKYLRVPMSALASFSYDPKPHPMGAAELGIPAPVDSVPEELLALDGQDAVLVGFMVPIEVDAKGVKQFVLSQNRSFCCYGVTPALNEMVLVRMQGDRRAPFLKDVPIAVYGGLGVSEQREGGYVVSLYRMDATQITNLVTYAQAAG